MSSAAENYQKLPGRGARRGKFPISFHYSRLWLGSDHLLMVTSTSWSEDYKRFYFRDIQGFALRRTAARRNWNIFYGVWAAWIGLAAAWVEHPAGSAVLWGMFAVPFFALLVNSIRGATCECQITTAVQKEFLPSLARLRVARKVIARVKPLIEQAQGILAPEEIAARAEEWPQVAEPGALEARRPAPSTRAARPVSPYAGRAHLVLFTLLLIESVRAAMDFYFRSTLITVLALTTGAAIVVMVIIALVKQQESAIPRTLRRLTWAAFVFVILLGVNGFAHYISLVMQYPDLAHSDAAILQMYVQLVPDESIWMMTAMLVAIFGSATLGAIGLLMVRNFRRSRKTPPPLISLDQTPPVSHP